MSRNYSWWFVSVVSKFENAIRVDSLDIDAVFAGSEREAIDAATLRNPLRPLQEFAVTRATRVQQEKAIRLNDKRVTEIADLQEIVESRCGMRRGS